MRLHNYQARWISVFKFWSFECFQVWPLALRSRLLTQQKSKKGSPIEYSCCSHRRHKGRSILILTIAQTGLSQWRCSPFRLYCKLVRRPGQGCSSAPWAPCRMQHSYRSFTVHHGVWFCLPGFHSNAAATGSLLGGRSSAGGTMSLFLSPSGKRFYNFAHTNNDCL